MNEVITIGVDLAKNVFQVHGVDAEGDVVFRRQLRRQYIITHRVIIYCGLKFLRCQSRLHQHSVDIGRGISR